MRNRRQWKSLFFLRILTGIERKHPNATGLFLSHSKDSSYQGGVERGNYMSKGEIRVMLQGL